MTRYLLVLAWVLTATCPAQTGYMISGTVVAGRTSAPLKHVLVTIAPVTARARQASYVTGEDGRFVFANLPAGKFALSAQKPNSFPEAFHQTEGYSTAIVTGPGLNSVGIVFPLTVSGSISGIVNDDEGDPVSNADVMLFHRAVLDGKSQTQSQGTAQTDSLGMFHFGQLKPGTYLIGVQARPWYAQNGFSAADDAPQPGQPSQFDVAYPITYYGGATDPNSASAITLAEGASTKVEVTLRAVPAAHVVLSAPEAEDGNRINIFVTGPGGYKIHTDATFMGTKDRAEFTGIAPGAYVVQKPSGGETAIDFGGHSVLDLRDIPECSVSGHLTFEGDERASAGADMMLVSRDGTVLRTRVAGDGAFEVSGAQPGRYEVQLSDARDYYVKSVAVEGRVIADQHIDVSDGSALHVSIVAAKGVSNIDGIALKESTPVAGAMVLLLPSDLNRTNLIRRDQSDSDGTFTLPNVVPGRYTLVAMDDGRDLAYAEPGVINAYLGGGQVIDVPLPRDSHLKVAVQDRQR